MFIDEQLLAGKNIILFGTGNAARKVLNNLSELNKRPTFFIDNNSELWDKEFEGRVIRSPFVLKELKKEDSLIIVSSMYYSEIKYQLCGLGLEEDAHFIWYEDLYKYPLQRKFDRICEKYDLVYQDKGNLIIRHIKETVGKIPAGEKIAIWGSGEHTEKLLQVIRDDIQIAFIVDSRKSEFEGLEVKLPTALLEEDIGTVIISSFEDRKILKEKLSEEYAKIRIIDFYELLDGKIICSRPFYTWDHWQYQIFMEVHLLKCSIKEEHDLELLKSLYRQLFTILLYIKDFEQLDYFIQEYVCKRLPDAEGFQKMYCKIDALFNKALRKVQSRSQHDIILFVFDSMRNQDLLSAPYLNSLKSNSFELQNAFSASTYTRASYIGMFSQQEHDGNDLSVREIDGSNSGLFKWLTENNYLIYQHGERPIQRVEQLENVKLPNQDRMWYPFTSRLWEVVCRLSQTDSPQFHLINTAEAHQPFICTKFDGEINMDYIPHQYYQYPNVDYSGSVKQHNRAISYLDSTMKQMHSFLSPETLSIICSDHGSRVGKGPIGHIFSCDDDTIHVPLIAYRSDYSHQVFPGLFSLKNIGALIIKLMEEDVIDPSLFTEYVVVERDPIFNPVYLSNESILRNVGDWIHAFKMVRNHDYKYILFENGNERLYKLPDEQTNMINNPVYSEVLQELRGKISSVFPYE